MAKWMQEANEEMKEKGTKGALRSELGAKKGQKIPLSKLEKASHSSNKLLKKRAVEAKNFRKASHKK